MTAVIRRGIANCVKSPGETISLLDEPAVLFASKHRNQVIVEATRKYLEQFFNVKNMIHACVGSISGAIEAAKAEGAGRVIYDGDLYNENANRMIRPQYDLIAPDNRTQALNLAEHAIEFVSMVETHRCGQEFNPQETRYLNARLEKHLTPYLAQRAQKPVEIHGPKINRTSFYAGTRR
jgi:hypothetical protein